jgi:PAS domain S-box-containing protein
MPGNPKLSFYPRPTGDISRDRNARTLQFSLLLFASAVGAIATLDMVSRETVPLPILVAVVGFAVAAAANRAGKAAWAGQTFILALMVSASLLVIGAHDGLRSNAMLVFPGLLLISVMLFDHRSYAITAAVVLVTVAGLGIAEKWGLTRAIPGVRSSATYSSIFYVDLILVVFAIIGSRIVNDIQKDVLDLRSSLRQLSAAHIDVSRTAEALRESEERLRLATKATQDAIWDIDLKTGKVSWNDTYANIYGRPPETSTSLQWWIDNIHPEERERTASHLQAAIGSNESSWTSEYRFRRVDGEWAHIYDRAYIARDSSGTAWRVIGAMQDLTDRKRAEARIRESEERFRRVFEEGPLGLGLLHRDFRIMQVNSALCQMIGYSENELLEMTFADITHPDDLHTDVELAERLFKGEIPSYRMQKRYIKKNGEILWMNLTASVLRDVEGRPLYGLGMVEDVTEIKRAQEESLARQKLESLGTLAGGIAHDFNNLLGAVGAQAELGLSELGAGASCKEQLHSIRDVAMRGSDIVRQLMIYAGKETNKIGLADLSAIVEEMLPLLKVSLSKHALMSANLSQELLTVIAGAAQLRQIVMNLITNASDAIGDRDGTILVTTRRVSLLKKESAAVPGLLPEGEYAALEVSDTGCGMSPETQDRIFDPFFSTKSAGRGLGLSVVSRIVRDLGGAVRLKSGLGKGTTVEVMLPITVTQSETSTYAPLTGIEPISPRQATVLVVEDEDVLRDGVVKILRRKGFDVLEAADGSAAIDMLRGNGRHIDLMLLDLTIPGASSWEVLGEATQVREDIRVVLTSAYAQEMGMDAAGVPQVRAFIRKPFQMADLLNVLSRSLTL